MSVARYGGGEAVGGGEIAEGYFPMKYVFGNPGRFLWGVSGGKQQVGKSKSANTHFPPETCTHILPLKSEKQWPAFILKTVFAAEDLVFIVVLSLWLQNAVSASALTAGTLGLFCFNSARQLNTLTYPVGLTGST